MPTNPFIAARAGVSTTRTLLKIVRAAQPISRADLARRLDVNRSTVTEIVRPLLDADVLREGATMHPRGAAGASQVGRPPIALTMNAEGRYFLGVNLGVRQSQVGAVTLDGETLAHETFDTPPIADDALERIGERVARVRAHIEGRTLIATGVSVPGPVDEARRKMLYAPHLDWTNLDLAAPIERALYGAGGEKMKAAKFEDAEARRYKRAEETARLVSGSAPVIVENDATAAAYYEARRRLARDKEGAGDDFILLRVGTGIGVGLVLGGEVYRGAAGGGMTGEFGHMTIVAGGKLCVCGNRGCWERYASATNAAALYQGEKGTETSEPRLRYLDVVARAEAGEHRARATLAQVGDYLGIGIANMVGGLGVTNVVVSGRIVHGWAYLRDSLFEAVERSMIGRLTRITVEAGEPTGAGLGGAIEVAIDDYLARLAP